MLVIDDEMHKDVPEWKIIADDHYECPRCCAYLFTDDKVCPKCGQKVR